MSTYVQILSIARPFPFDTDDNARVLWSTNYEALAWAPTTDFEGEIAKLINDAGLGTKGTDLFIGPKAKLPAPETADPIVQILDTGGSAPTETHDGSKYEALSCQIIVRGLSHPAARTRALAIWRALDGVRNTAVTA